MDIQTGKQQSDFSGKPPATRSCTSSLPAGFTDRTAFENLSRGLSAQGLGKGRSRPESKEPTHEKKQDEVPPPVASKELNAHRTAKELNAHRTGKTPAGMRNRERTVPSLSTRAANADESGNP